MAHDTEIFFIPFFFAIDVIPPMLSFIGLPAGLAYQEALERSMPIIWKRRPSNKGAGAPS